MFMQLWRTQFDCSSYEQTRYCPVISIVMSYFIAGVKSLILLSREKYGDGPMKLQLKTYNSSASNEYLHIEMSARKDMTHEKLYNNTIVFAEPFNYWHL